MALHIWQNYCKIGSFSIIINFLLFSCSGTYLQNYCKIGSFSGSLLFDRVSKLKFLVTYICPNHLKLHMGIYKSLYYENLLSIIINFLLFSCSGTSNLAKLLQDWQLFLVVYCLTGCHKIKVFSHLYMSKSLETLYGYL